jgi:hypothetical protein
MNRRTTKNEEKTVNRTLDRKQVAHGLTLIALLTGTATFLVGDQYNTDRNNQFDFALIGDVPYAPTFGTTPNKVQIYPSPEYDAVVADINAHTRVLFTVHMGDIKAGDTWCVGGLTGKDPAGAANVYTTNLTLFNNFVNAAVYLPGDNEWTDCHRTNNGLYNPTERLSYLRGIFFTTNQSLGQHPMTLTRQSSDVGFELNKENVTWRTGNILFVGINQPGSNNNHQRNVTQSFPAPTDSAETEYLARNTANLTWITKAFTTAMSDTTVKGIVIMQQANPFERFLETGQGYTRSGYEDFMNLLRSKTVAFGKPVLFVGGDTHTVRIDKPMTYVLNSLNVPVANAQGNLAGYPAHTGTTGSNVVTPTTLFSTIDGSPGCAPAGPTCVTSTRIQTLTRAEVFGSPDTHWMRVIVDPADPNLFSFAMHTIAGNGHGRDGRTDDDDLQ